MPDVVTAGNSGDKIRSDCFVTLSRKNSGGVSVEIKSKVGALYGKDIEKMARSVLSLFNIQNAVVSIEDTGALSFVIAARLEAAARLLTGDDNSVLFPVIDENQYGSSRERFRFSRLYLPGNTPSMMINAGLHKPDGIILDLEDSVAPSKKDEARLLVRNALCRVDFYGAERMVRINQVPAGLEDLKFIVPHNVHLILVPKCEDPEEISLVEREIARISKSCGRKTPVYLMPIIESALGIENAFSIAKASENIVALAIGLEDYTADLGTRRTPEGHESYYARTRLVNACKAAGIQAIDSVFSDVGDEEGLKENIRISKGLGFEGMGCIHPRQIQPIFEGYAPDSEELAKARKIADAFKLAEEQGLGVVSLGTKMIDPPVVKRALKTIELAEKLGLIDKNRRNDNDEQ